MPASGLLPRSWTLSGKSFGHGRSCANTSPPFLGKAAVTTPHQRTRSVLQTRRFLSKLISADAWPGVPREVQDEARRLLYHYPETWHLSRLHERLPADWGSLPAVQGEDP